MVCMLWGGVESTRFSDSPHNLPKRTDSINNMTTILKRLLGTTSKDIMHTFLPTPKRTAFLTSKHPNIWIHVASGLG